MRGAYITGYGDPRDVVRVGDMPNPELHPDEVLIEVRAAGVNPIDWKIVEGAMRSARPMRFPAPIGYDAAGIVREGGGTVTRFKPGDEIYTRVDAMHPGTFAEWIAVDEKLVALKPRNLSFEQAAAVPLAALTAWQGLFEHIKLQRGQKILIQGGAGGVGSFAVQFAKHAGAMVATTVGTDHVVIAKMTKADVVIDHHTQRFEEFVSDYDAVFDTVGGEVQSRSLTILKQGGILVSTRSVPTDKKEGKRLASFTARPDGKQLAEIGRLIESGAVTPVIDHIYPLEEATDALLQSRTGHAGGKIVIRVH
jgi:NADPH:quinone reductase-like Zn-dependent oxidoreductase